MASVLVDGEDVEIQDAFDALSSKVKRLQTTLDQTMAHGPMNRTDVDRSPMDLTLAADGSRPNFELVSSIPTFDGTRADLLTPFLENIDGIAELSNWTEAQKLRVTKLKLAGSALRFVQSDEKCKEATTYAEIRASLIERFGDSLPDHYYFEELAGARQGRSESIEQFADRVKRLSDRTTRTTAHEEANKILREEADRRAMEAFVRGLSGETGRQTRIKFPKTFREAVCTAISINNLERRPLHDDEKPRKVFGATSQQNCFNCGELGHKARDCGRHESQHQRQVESCGFCRKRGHSEQDCRTKANSLRPQCFNCKKPGHLANDCWGTRVGPNSDQGRGGMFRGRGGMSRGRGGMHRGRGYSQQGPPLNTNGAPRFAAGNPTVQ